MLRKKKFTLLLLLMASMLLFACGKEKAAESVTPANNASDNTVQAPAQAEEPEPEDDKYEGMLLLSFAEDGTYTFREESKFYTEEQTLAIAAPEGAKIFYTLDGSTPTKDSKEFTDNIILNVRESLFPKLQTLRAKCFYADGTESNVAARSYLIYKNAESRFTTLVLSVSGDPADITDKPDGIFYGKNYEQRGRESERPVFTEMWDQDGNEIFSQFAGVRIYGAYSRSSTIKSMKLFSRKSYDPDHKNFKFDYFDDTSYATGDVIDTYDKLVVRNTGNDFQFLYIRDELAETLAREAGFRCYEEVLPVVCYLNGEYYGYFWLHETYCDKYFKEKFGDGEGEFVVIEGSENQKNEDDDELTQKCVDEYQTFYDDICADEVIDDADYERLNAFMDVEDYLRYYAFQIVLGNWDWPQNNYKCYRYVPAEGEAKGDAEFDGRWRYLVHDLDYSMGLYDQDKVLADYNNLERIMDPNDERYSKLFTILMKRDDCRQYFKSMAEEYANGVFSKDTLLSVYNELHATRKTELNNYFKFLGLKRSNGDETIWGNEGAYKMFENSFFTFADERSAYILRYINEMLP